MFHNSTTITRLFYYSLPSSNSALSIMIAEKEVFCSIPFFALNKRGIKNILKITWTYDVLVNTVVYYIST